MAARAPTYAVTVDYAQNRVLYDALTVLAQGSYEGRKGRVPGWDVALSSADTWVDPVTFTAFLRPLPLTPEWGTTGSGDYARLTKSSFTLSSPSSWVDDPTAFATDYWIRATALTTAANGVTLVTYPEDQGWHVGAFTFDATATEYVLLEFGWHTAATLTAGTGVRLYSSGRAEVWRAGKKVNEGEVTGSTGGQINAQEFLTLLALPTRGKELLLIGSGGNGFTTVLDDVEEGDDIVPASPFWFNVPELGTRAAKLQFAPVKYKSTGALVSTPLSFAEPPDPSQTESREWFAEGGGSVDVAITETDGTTPFVADGVRRDCRLRVTLSGGPNVSPALYAAIGVYAAKAETTPDFSARIEEYVTRATLSVPEGPWPAKVEMDLVRIGELEQDLGVPMLRHQANRPVAVDLYEGGELLCPVLAGRAEPPEWDYGFDEDRDTVLLVVSDRWKALESYVFRDAYPLDGLPFADAVKVALLPAWLPDERIDVEATALTLPKAHGQAAGEWSFLIEPGERASDVLRRLFDSFAPDWFFGFVPYPEGTRFVARSPDGLGTTPATTLYRTADEAVAAVMADGFSEEAARMGMLRQRVVQDYRERSLEPEATVVYVTGWDSRKDAPIQAFKRDALAEDPSLDPASRPDNWVGEPRPYGWVDPALNTQDLVEAACEALFRRLTVRRVIGEWRCEQLFTEGGRPVWRGDCVEIEGLGIYRVTSLVTDVTKDMSDPLVDGDYGYSSDRQTVYTGELVREERDAWRGYAAAPGLDAAAAAHEQRVAIRPRVRDPRSLFLGQRDPLTRVGL